MAGGRCTRRVLVATGEHTFMTCSENDAGVRAPSRAGTLITSRSLGFGDHAQRSGQADSVVRRHLPASSFIDEEERTVLHRESYRARLPGIELQVQLSKEWSVARRHNEQAIGTGRLPPATEHVLAAIELLGDLGGNRDPSEELFQQGQSANSQEVGYGRRIAHHDNGGGRHAHGLSHRWRRANRPGCGCRLRSLPP